MRESTCQGIYTSGLGARATRIGHRLGALEEDKPLADGGLASETARERTIPML
jgi:hypothetical protein